MQERQEPRWGIRALAEVSIERLRMVRAIRLRDAMELGGVMSIALTFVLKAQMFHPFDRVAIFTIGKFAIL